MARQEILIKSKDTQPMKLSPASFLPKMSFPIYNDTGVDIKITVDGKDIRIERQEG